MPMNFPDMKSLVGSAQVHGFREPLLDENEDGYRAALADHVQPRDLVESMEIRTGKGWDQWDDGEKAEMLGRGIAR